MPEGLDFSIGKFDAYQFSQMQSSPHIQAYLNALGIFCRGKSMNDPIYSAGIFTKLAARGFSGLKEKRSKINCYTISERLSLMSTTFTRSNGFRSTAEAAGNASIFGQDWRSIWGQRT